MRSVAVVIPCYNERAYIERCIRSVLEQKADDCRIEVIAVDGMSTDGTRPLLHALSRTHAQLLVIDNPARATPTALNLGLRASQASVKIILGAHAHVGPHFVSKNLEALDAHPEAGLVGGVIHNIHENKVARHISAAMSSPFGVGNAKFRTGGQAGYADTVAFGAYRSEVLEKVGYFNELLLRNQDDELSYRIAAAGIKIWFDPAIESYYYVRGSYRKLARQYFQYGYWNVYVNRLHTALTSWRQLVPAALVLSLALSTALALFLPALRWLAPGICALWLATAGIALLLQRTAWVNWPGQLLAFAILHLSYGLGYLRGLFDFLLLKKNPDASNARMSR